MMNCFVGIGRLTKDVQLNNYTDNEGMERAICKFTIAVDREGRPQGSDKADFLRIVVFGRQADNCGKYLKKGSRVGVKGRVQTGQYQDKNGNTIYTTDIVADRVEFLSPVNQESNQQAPEDDVQERFAALNEDVPF